MRTHRKTTPKVKDGRVQKKNRHDRISTKDKMDNAPRGEKYAEDYALKYEKIIWNRFFEEFNMT